MKAKVSRFLEKKRKGKSENVFLIRVCDLIGHRADMPSLISTDRLKQSGERRNRIVLESPWSLGQRPSWETFGVVLVVVGWCGAIFNLPAW